jgi:LruC domain-containing protein
MKATVQKYFLATIKMLLPFFFVFASLLLNAQIFTVTNTNDTGAGSLRQAIIDANAYSGANPQVVFDIPFPATNSEGGWDWWTITITSASLPTITKAGAQILGFSQSVNRGIVDNDPVGTGGTVGVDQIPLPLYERPTICINAADKTAPININAASVVLEGISIYNSTENTVYVQGNSAGTHVRKMFVGVLPNGNRPALDAERNNRFGVAVDANPNNLITVSHCYIGHNGRLGINGGTFSSVVLFEYNEVFESNWYGSNAHDGIDVNGLNSTVRYNLVYSTRSGSNVPPTASNSGGSGIECGSTTPTKETNFLIENNTCYSNDGAGINVINGCTKNTIRKNICYDNEVGISVTTRTGTDPATAFITMNSVYGNNGAGIDINHTKISTGFDGITENGTASVGTEPFGNNRQKYPVITSAYNQDGSFFVEGMLTSVANTTHRLEFFVNSAKDVYYGNLSDFGEGETFLFAFDVLTDNDGNAPFLHEEVLTATTGYYISSTATDTPAMTTSEFSPVVEITDNSSGALIENFFPATGFGTLAFEDLWPSKGDYDFNDLVIDYQFKILTNTDNKVEQMKGTFIIKAFGASLQNGFGFQLSENIDAANLTVSGSSLTENFITLDGNGTEAGQTKPTIIVFDNAYKQMQHSGSGTGVNTTPGMPYVTPDTVKIQIVFTPDTYTYGDLDISNFNPFLIQNKDRSVEVHLPDYPPTDLVNEGLFGTINDDSNPGTGKYYKTAENLPWAIHLYEGFDYPIEKEQIISAYLKFAEWANSSGTLFTDWYKDLPGYRDPSKIYPSPSK